MMPSLVLDDRQFETASKLLEIELRELLPSQIEVLIYRCFTAGTAIVAAAFIWFLLRPGGFPEDASSPLAMAIIVQITLLVCSGRLIRKFWRLAKLRKRLGLVGRLATFFSTRRTHAQEFGRYVLSSLALVAGVLFLAFAGFVALQPGNVHERHLFVTVALLSAIGMFALPMMQRAESRLRVVVGLQKSLSRGEFGTSDKAFGELAAEFLAQLERSRIGLERQASLRAESSTARTGYAVQQSAQAREAKAGLGSELARAVDNSLIALVDDPFPSAAAQDEAGDTRAVVVPGTPLRLRYRVDRTARVIWILEVVHDATSDTGASDAP